jgi:S-formylglutathione hydrolase FrmB
MTFRTPAVSLTWTLLLAAAVLSGSLVTAQTGIPSGTVERVTVHGKSLEGNLAGDSPDRSVSIYLPPGYATTTGRRYPVIYLLHGFTDSDDRWYGRVQHFINVPQVVDRALASGSKDAIVVMPNALTKSGGSMYSSSVTTGDWEIYIARELVSYVDTHYRTIANVSGRGLAGHSMGGYGALRIGMKYPDVFAAVYALSPCCMISNMTPQAGLERGGPTPDSIRSFEELEKASFGLKAQMASAAAWSPNPKNPPFFIDLPMRNGEFQPLVAARWAANAPLAMVDQYIGNLKRLRAIAFDAGDMDEPIATTVRTLDGMLNGYGLPHTFEIYTGNHVNRVAERVEKQMMPFFSAQLTATR